MLFKLPNITPGEILEAIRGNIAATDIRGQIEANYDIMYAEEGSFIEGEEGLDVLVKLQHGISMTKSDLRVEDLTKNETLEDRINIIMDYNKKRANENG